MTTLDPTMAEFLQAGMVIPASPLALTTDRKLDERHQRALWRYYCASGAGGVAVAVHTTQFAIREHGLFEPLLQLASDEFDQQDQNREQRLMRVAGICGQTDQAVSEAQSAADVGFHAGLLNLGALSKADEGTLIDHCRAVADVIPVFGFYLSPAVGGRLLPYTFWRRFMEIPNVVAIKVAAFNRYQTIDVVRAVAESGRDDVALYTGNDDNIVGDLITPYRFNVNGQTVERRFAGGLLGHWAVWTKCGVELLQHCHSAVRDHDEKTLAGLIQTNIEVTDMNATIFDAPNNFVGCIPGIHYVLHRQGLLAEQICLDPDEILSPGQADEIDRVCNAYPHLIDDEFIAEHRDAWLKE